MSDIVKAEPSHAAQQPELAAAPPAWQEESPPLERIREFYYRVILRHKWLILVIVLAVLPLAAIQSYTTTRLYRSTITLQFNPNFSEVLPYKEVAGAERNVSGPYMQAQAASMKSTILAAKIVERMKLDQDSKFLAPRSKGIFVETLNGIQNKIVKAAQSLIAKKGEGPATAASKVSPTNWLIFMFLADLEVDMPEPGSQILPVSCVSHDPDLANRLVETTVDEFIHQNTQSKYRATTEASEFLDKQIEEQKIKLQKAEESLINYARAHNILDFDKDRGEQTVMQRLSALSSQLSSVQAKMNGVKANYEMAQTATPENFPPILNNNAIAELQHKLSTLKQEQAELSTRFGPRWPEIIQVKEQVAQVEAQLVQEKKKAIDDARSYYQTTTQEYRNALSNLENQKRLAEQQNESDIQYKTLLRDENTNRQLYDALLQRSKEAGISASLKPDNIRIIDRQQAFPNVHFSPKTGMAIGLGFMFGLALGVGCAFLLTALDNSLKTPEELETLIGLPALGMIPTIRTLKASPPEVSQALEPLGCEPHGPAIIPWRQLVSTSGEPYRSLRTAILLSQSDHPPQTILVTSALPSEGKTITAVNLAIVLAQTGARTLVMDLDMRKPRLANIFGIENRIGMSVYLSGNISEVTGIVKTAIPNLSILCSGAIPPNPAELIGSHRMKQCLLKLKQSFNYIVIDTPPVLPCTDTVVLSTCVDGVVLVARGGKTPRKALENAAVQLMSVGGRILGVVLNDLDLAKPEYAYHFGRYYQHYPYYSQSDVQK